MQLFIMMGSKQDMQELYCTAQNVVNGHVSNIMGGGVRGVHVALSPFFYFHGGHWALVGGYHPFSYTWPVSQLG